MYLKDNRSVIKLNDAIYYLSWIDYVEQSYIKATEKTNLNYVEQFMNTNGFQKIRNNDYFNQESGIIIEDLHDENVLTNNGILYFIDTVFYLK